MGSEKGLPFGQLRYLYVGSSNVQKDLEYYTGILGAKKVWDISSSGTRVAALRLGRGPAILLADHRPAGTCILIFQIEDLATASKQLRKKGWKPEGESFEIPEGPCYRFNDPSGNPLALLEVIRPMFSDRALRMRVDSLNWNPLFSGKQYPCFQELAAQAHFLDQAWVTESEVIVTSEEEPGLRAASGLFLLVKVLGELFVLPSMS